MPILDGVILAFLVASLTIFHLIGGLIIECPCLVGMCSHLKRFVMM
jgi:hypothetical protein